MTKINLFCFPHAGSSAMYFMQWKKYLNSEINLCPMELKGRGQRINEPFYTSFEECIDDMYSQMQPYLDGTPYILFGHSMGSYIVFELYYRLIKLGVQNPIHIFFSGQEVPPTATIANSSMLHKLPDALFKEKVAELGATPAEVLDNAELCEFFLPIIKNDYKITEYYYTQNNASKINCDISILRGDQDNSVSYDKLLSWKNYAAKNFDMHTFSGNHFFILSQAQEVVKLINTAYTSYTTKKLPH